jgi:protein tyrosine phosphatase (PTP) superfamily phosphohydrolase (DUF442 family)
MSVGKRPFLLGGSASLLGEELDFLADSEPILWIAWIALGAFVVGIGIVRWYWSHRYGRFFTVVEGRLYRSGAMHPDRLQRLVCKHGIRSVIDLRSARPAVDAEREALALVGVAHHHVPSKQMPRAETIEAVLALLDVGENLPALIHCNHGVRRAAQFEAICRMEYQDWSNERALFVLRRRSGFLSFRPGSRGNDFLRSYVPRRSRKTAIAS